MIMPTQPIATILQPTRLVEAAELIGGIYSSCSDATTTRETTSAKTRSRLLATALTAKERGG
jgi:hypothetical protein